ncbi:MAG TPA: DUF6318 family protein [Acidothermaceae bacterium]
MGYRRGTLLFVLLGVVTLAGCSADVSHPSALGSESPTPPAAAIGAPASPSPSPTASSTGSVESPSPATSGTATNSDSGTASPPTSADVIAMNVRDTAQAYIADFNIALATGDTTKIEALTSPTCGCRQLVNTINQMSAHGQRYDGVVFTIKSIDVTYLAAGAAGDVKFSISAGRVVDVAGNEVRGSSPTPNQENDLFMVNTNGRWTVEQSYLLGANNK